MKIPKDQIAVSIKLGNGDKKILDDQKVKLCDLGVKYDTEIQVKDLGKQIKWEYVFYIEYLGPIIIIPTMYFLGYKGLYTWVQPFAAIMGVTHYVKR